ncbi:MAG: helix-turn-helix transcriptional regulator [Candidatus Gastranaerophilales bacterium]
MQDVKKLLGMRIRELRKERGVSQEYIAEKVGIEPNNISRIENGINYPTAENLAKIAFALDIEIHKLFYFEHMKSINDIKKDLIELIDDDEQARALYKYYMLIKE